MKPDSPFWWADIRIAGKRHRISTKQKSKTKAAQVEAALIHKLSSGEITGLRHRAPVLRDYAVNFLEYVAQSRRSERTKEYYRNGWRMLEKQNIAGMRLDGITTSTAEVLAIPGAGATVNCALRTLRRMLSLAEEKNLIVKVPRIRLVEEVEREALIEPQVEAIILAKAPRVLRHAYLLIADCGVRPSDAVAIRWEEVDFVNREILIAGGKTGKKGRRQVSMSSRVCEMLIERARTGGEWVFPSLKLNRAGKPMTAHGLSSRFAEFKRTVGLPKDVVLYSARHTFATDVTEATGDITKTQKALGHTQLKTTVRYVHARAANTGAIMDARNAVNLGHVFGHGADTVQ
jgi:integrase